MWSATALAQSDAVDLTSVFRAEGIEIDRLLVYKIDGIVLIRGRTSNAAMAERAGRFARSLGHVRVANLIDVVPRLADSEIERLAVRALDLAPGLEGCSFQIQSVAGIVRLTGDVQRSIQGDMAIALLLRIDGITAVNPELVTGKVDRDRELFSRYLAELRKVPEDQALRERIIRLAHTFVRLPSIPDEAERSFVSADSFEKEARDIDRSDPLGATARDFAIAAYRKALLIAPWWPEAYFGLSASLESAGHVDAAADALQLYLIAQPQVAGETAAGARLRAIAARSNRVPRGL
jgi:hypothetical protein